jgi:pyruvate dehydrogenase E2 component (dihydrolipoamide acetyltransferase)
MYCTKIVSRGMLLRNAARVTSQRVSGRFLSAGSYPTHEVVGMPALSPTMETGTIGKWLCKPGDKISPGDALAEIETDKASMAFEAQDEFVIAKLLVETGAEVKVGDAIFISVEDPASVSAFANYAVVKSAPVAAPVAPAAAPAPAPVAAPAPAPAAVAVPAPAATPKVAAPASAPVAKAPAATATATAAAPTAAPASYFSVLKKGPLYHQLNVRQTKYIEQYGRSAHQPI